MTTAQQKKVLIVGGGIAGVTLAYWLAKSEYVPIVIERAPDMRTTGQAIEIDSFECRQICADMGITEEVIRQHGTAELGLRFIGGHGKSLYDMPMSRDGYSFTSELEILRGDLVKLIYEQTLDDVKYRFSESVVGVSETAEFIKVDFESGNTEEFDLMIICDGLYSGTRKLCNFSEVDIKHLGQYTAFFTIRDQLIGVEDSWARWYNAIGGRALLARPDRTRKNTRAFLSIMADLSSYRQLSIDGQKDLIRKNFTGAGYKVDQILDAMQASEDFYMTGIAQVRCPRWRKGRAVLCGDAAYCPSPISGMGTDCAIFGAYILAGELSRLSSALLPDDSRDNETRDYTSAFTKYESIVRPFVEKVQDLPPGAPGLANPQSQWGLSVLRGVLRLVNLVVATYNFTSPYIPDKIKRWILPAGKGRNSKAVLPNYSWAR